MRKIIFLLWTVVLASVQPLSAQINSGSPAKPFGSNTSYQYGIMPTNLPASGTFGKSQAAADAYNAWKTTYVEACSGGQYRVKHDDPNNTVSEGIAYGMLLSVYAGDKTLFDGLWAYYKQWSNNKGIMNWRIVGCNNISGYNGATDAELDAAMALIIAGVQWSSATSPYNYKNEANTLINAIKNHEMENDGNVKPGDAWNTCRNPSYYSPAYFREFAKINTANAQFWNNAVAANETFLLKNRNSATGLVSNWADFNGNPVSCNGGDDSYGYESIRNPWRMATDYLWNGPTAAKAAADICGKVAANIKGSETNLKIPCATNSKLSSGRDKGGVAYMTACASMGSTEQSSLNSLYTELSNSNNFRWDNYYGATLRCITLFMMTGNFWSPDASITPSCPVSYTVTFDFGGGTSVSPGEEEVCSGEKVTRPANDPTRTGYDFTGWYTTATGNEAFNFNQAINSNTTIYAQWEKGEGPTMIADCDKGKGSKTQFLTYWYAYDDNKVTPAPGNSTTEPKADGLFKMTAPGAAGSDSAAVMTYTLNKGGLGYDPFVGLGFDTKDPVAAYDLSCASGISFYYKNSNSVKIRFMVKTSNVLDDAHWGYDLPVESNWTPITIAWSELAQPSWGAEASWNASLITGFQWQIQGANGTSGTVGIDQVQLNDCNVNLPIIDTGIWDINSSISGLQIYPNPAKGGNFNVVLPNSEIATLTISNQQGQAVYSIVINDGFASIDTNLSAGIYIVSVQSENGLEVQKLIVK